MPAPARSAADPAVDPAADARAADALVRAAAHLAAVSLVGLIFLSLAWELWLAPIRPGGSLLALKALPLLLPLFGVLRGRRYTFQWSSMFILLYFSEGVMRGWGDQGLSQRLAWAEIALSVLFFAAAVAYARLSGARAA